MIWPFAILKFVWKTHMFDFRFLLVCSLVCSQLKILLISISAHFGNYPLSFYPPTQNFSKIVEVLIFHLNVIENKRWRHKHVMVMKSLKLSSCWIKLNRHRPSNRGITGRRWISLPPGFDRFQKSQAFRIKWHRKRIGKKNLRQILEFLLIKRLRFRVFTFKKTQIVIMLP